jgi:uroporphyrinogen decarboxylase
MNPRERYLATLLFGTPDRIPFETERPKESTLAAWHTQGLPQGVDWFQYLLETLGVEPEKTRAPVDLGVDSRMIPQFEEKVLEHRDGHVVVQDWSGSICEIPDRYDVTYLRDWRDFVARRWIRFPVENRRDWERMKERYRLDTPGRFPDDFEKRCREAGERDDVLAIGFAGPFWQMREWCGLEGLCILMADEPEFVAELASFHADFVSGMLDRILGSIVPDVVQLSEDLAFKGRSMISPAMVRRFLKPAYDRWVSAIRKAGCRLVDVDSDGYLVELIPIWIESGINVCDPVEVAAGNDVSELRGRFGRRIAYRGGIDKRAIAKGGRAIRDEMKRVEPVVRDGGYIPSCDHRVPPDISWPNFVEYSRLLARMTGWL